MAHFLRGVCLCGFRLRLFSDTQFFRLHLKHSIVAVQRVELTFQNVLIGHFLTLPFIVHHKHAAAHYKPIIEVIQQENEMYEIQRRSLMSTPLKIELAAKKYPACFTAFDILYYEDHPVTDLPLTERKALLQKAVIEESARFAVSRVVENNGVAFFWLAKARELEGIIAKRKDSRYYFDKRTKDWIKCKNLKDADYVVCGYLPKENGRISLVLGQYAGGTLTYKGHVTLGVCGGSFRRIRELPRLDTSPFAAPAGNERAVWVAPVLCCTVKYMEKTESGHLRQPVFKGLREDKLPEECVEHESRVTEKRRG